MPIAANLRRVATSSSALPDQPVVGAIAYYQLLSLALSLGLQPSDLKIATAALVLVTLGLPFARSKGAMRETMRA